MEWQTIPAIGAAGVMVVIGLGALIRPSALEMVGVTATSPLGISQVRAVFGGMFVALGVACLLTREPIVFAVVGTGDVAVRVVAVFVDRVPFKGAILVLAIGSVLGAALVSGYWFA